MAKAVVLGLSYGASAKKFVAVAKAMADLDITLEEATRIVAEFRRSNKHLLACWRQLENNMRRSVGEDFTIELPSGRKMHYFNVSSSGGSLSAQTERGGYRTKWWSSKLFENVCQGMARDILCDAILRLERAGYRMLFSAHDEIIFNVDNEEEAQQIANIMAESPSWAPDLPLEVEGDVSPYYKK